METLKVNENGEIILQLEIGDFEDLLNLHRAIAQIQDEMDQENIEVDFYLRKLLMATSPDYRIVQDFFKSRYQLDLFKLNIEARATQNTNN